MQLNALLCCLWRNVEACHKHFVIFSCNQHRRLLPAMCHNLRYDGRGPPATVLTPACCSVNSIAVKKPDNSSESWFLPTTPAFDASVRGGVPLEYCCAVWHGKTRMAWLPDVEKMLMICLFILIEFTNVTDTHRHTDTAWWHRPRLHSIARQKNERRHLLSSNRLKIEV